MNFNETLREIESINGNFFELNKQIDAYREKRWHSTITDNEFDELIKPFEEQKKDLFIKQELLINNARCLLFDEKISTFISVWNCYAKKHRRLGEKTKEKIEKEFEEKSEGCNVSIRSKFTFSLRSPMNLLNYHIANIKCYLHDPKKLTDENNYILELSINDVYSAKYKYIEDIPGTIKKLHEYAINIKKKTQKIDRLKKELEKAEGLDKLKADFNDLCAFAHIEKHLDL